MINFIKGFNFNGVISRLQSFDSIYTYLLSSFSFLYVYCNCLHGVNDVMENPHWLLYCQAWLPHRKLCVYQYHKNKFSLKYNPNWNAYSHRGCKEFHVRLVLNLDFFQNNIIITFSKIELLSGHSCPTYHNDWKNRIANRLVNLRLIGFVFNIFV